MCECRCGRCIIPTIIGIVFGIIVGFLVSSGIITNFIPIAWIAFGIGLLAIVLLILIALFSEEDAEECVNDTWLKAWNAIPPSRPMRLSLFLGTITRNLSLDRWKGKKAMKRGRGETQVALEELSECIPNNDCTEDAVEAAELERLLNSFLHTLPERDCNVFLRRYWYVEDYAAIAERYGLKLNTVKTSLFRTRNKLKDFLMKEGIVL